MPGEQTDALASLTIFYSYAHEDEALRDKLEEHLSSLQAQGLISGWYDRQIVAGTEWAYAIDSHLQTASIILLLISPAFMASDYCVSIEMQQAMERHRLGDVRVIPIILEPTAWHDAPFAILQCLPRGARPVTTWDNPEDAFEDITQGVRHAIEELNLLYTGGPRRLLAPLTLAPADGQWRKVSNRLPAQIDSQSRRRMLECVRAWWITGLLKDSLHEAALITLGLHEQSDAVANPWSFSLQEMNQPARPLRIGTRIIQAYDYAQGELLILGEPGSGKTTLLLELTRDLIERAKRDETHPIPVVFNLSSWSLKQQPIVDWLVEELVFKYQVPRKLAEHWVETEQILPLLDDLDEVAPNHRVACIEVLNRYKQDHGLLPMVICSRSADYLAQQSRVLLRTAIVIQPLTQEQIESYLASAKKQLAPIREALQEDAELQELASTPLMLSILTLAYHGSSLNDLHAIPSPLARRRQILATYVQRMFQRRGGKANYTPQQTIQWLAWLARQMVGHSQTDFYLERLQSTWLPTKPAHIIHELLGKLLSALASMLFVMLLLGLASALSIWLAGVLGSKGLVLGLIGLLGIVLAILLLEQRVFTPRGSQIQPLEKLTWSRNSFLKKLFDGLFVGLVFGLGGGLVGGLLVGLGAGLVGGVSDTQIDEHARLRPNQGIQASGWNALRSGIVVGLAGILSVGLFVGLVYGPVDGLLVGLCVGLVGGLGIGLAYGGAAYLQYYFLRFLLWRSRVMPWHYAHFLDYAAERILLRKVGGGYIFIHRFMLDYFASLETIPTTEKSAEHVPSG